MANRGLWQPALETHRHQLLAASAQQSQCNVLARRRDQGVLLRNECGAVVRVSFSPLQKQQQQSGQPGREAVCHWYYRFACQMWCCTHIPLTVWAPTFPLVIPTEWARTLSILQGHALSSCMLMYWRHGAALQQPRAACLSDSLKETNILIALCGEQCFLQKAKNMTLPTSIRAAWNLPVIRRAPCCSQGNNGTFVADVRAKPTTPSSSLTSSNESFVNITARGLFCPNGGQGTGILTTKHSEINPRLR